MLIDIHGHPPRTEADLPRYLAALRRWDSRLLVSHLGPRATGWLNEPEIHEWRLGNDECAELVSQHRNVLSGNLRGESTPLDLLALARRHPKVKFFGGHTGGDWEWGVAALKQVDNVWLDVAGGEVSGGYAATALRTV